MSINKTSCLCLVAMLSCSGLGFADTLELRNGDILEGVYKGGTANSIRFEVGDALETVSLTGVLALTIDQRSRTAKEIESIDPPMEEDRFINAPPPQPQPVVDPADILLPAGSPLLVRIIETIDSRQHEVGHRFMAELQGDVYHNDIMVARRGTRLFGSIVDANQAGRIKGKTHLVLRMHEIVIRDQRYDISTSEYREIGNKSSGKRSTLKILGGAALGAIINDDDRGEGAAVGAGVGLGVAAITRGEKLTVPAGTLIEFELSTPLTR